jgi:hypothetical protein
MDSVMSSPSSRAQTARLDQVDLASLSLGVPSAVAKRERSIFAFGTSDTWGSAGSNNAPTDWSVLGSGNGIGAGTENQSKAVGPPSFLSLSSNNTWGTAGLFGSDHGTTAD